MYTECLGRKDFVPVLNSNSFLCRDLVFGEYIHTQMRMCHDCSYHGNQITIPLIGTIRVDMIFSMGCNCNSFQHRVLIFAGFNYIDKRQCVLTLICLFFAVPTVTKWCIMVGFPVSRVYSTNCLRLR